MVISDCKGILRGGDLIAVSFTNWEDGMLKRPPNIEVTVHFGVGRYEMKRREGGELEGLS
jgi:hypothetical protein